MHHAYARQNGKCAITPFANSANQTGRDGVNAPFYVPDNEEPTDTLAFEKLTIDDTACLTVRHPRTGTVTLLALS